MNRTPITEPADALEILASDPAERIIRTHIEGGSEWHLERDRREVTGAVVELLRRGGPLLERFDGHLVPVAGGLLAGAAMAQTFIWRPERAPVH